MPTAERDFLHAPFASAETFAATPESREDAPISPTTTAPEPWASPEALPDDGGSADTTSSFTASSVESQTCSKGSSTESSTDSESESTASARAAPTSSPQTASPRRKSLFYSPSSDSDDFPSLDTSASGSPATLVSLDLSDILLERPPSLPDSDDGRTGFDLGEWQTSQPSQLGPAPAPTQNQGFRTAPSFNYNNLLGLMEALDRARRDGGDLEILRDQLDEIADALEDLRCHRLLACVGDYAGRVSNTFFRFTDENTIERRVDLLYDAFEVENYGDHIEGTGEPLEDGSWREIANACFRRIRQAGCTAELQHRDLYWGVRIYADRNRTFHSDLNTRVAKWKGSLGRTWSGCGRCYGLMRARNWRHSSGL